jgi:GT2 family glycosyltransferase
MAVASEEVAVVVIGRNEGDRLRLSLESVRATGLNSVYVDSGSVDRSIELAGSLAIDTLELDPSRPFSAARARNEGLQEACRRWPSTKYVMFLDGDCVLNSQFPWLAAARLEAQPEWAIVTGHLAEQHPDASVYNRLCAIEWRSPAGPIENMNGLGGIMMVRVSAFRMVGGFDEQAIAGEEPDLGVRLGLAGYSVVKIDQPMAMHDAQILRFGQWWKRATRNGHALAHRYARHGRTRFRDGRSGLQSALFWGLALPIVVLVFLWPTRGLSLLLLAGYGLLGWRVFRHYSRTGLSREDAWLVTQFIFFGKFAECIGVLRYCTNRARGRFEVIEYK